MKIFLAGAKDIVLENGCLERCPSDQVYRRLFSFAYEKDMEFMLKHFSSQIEKTLKEDTDVN